MTGERAGATALGPAAGGDRAEPVFLLATARSYSTVTIAMLSRHPRIFGFPELQIFRVPRVADLLAAPTREASQPPWHYLGEWERTGIYRALAQVHEAIQDPPAISRARSWLERHAQWPMEHLMDHLLGEVAPSIGLEKSPATLGYENGLQRCLAAYPRARFIHLVRHPAAAQNSMHEYWRERFPTDLRARCAQVWYVGNLRAAKTLRNLPAERWIRLRAEDLMTRPDDVLPAVLGWLGLDASADLVGEMKHPERWEFAGRGQDGSLGGGDAKFLRRSELRPIRLPGPVEFDSSWEVSRPFFDRIKLLATYFGY
ncbi:MAG TPA: sulfotransferase [Streptosporangiaceae bacterium]|nr:sulfotransferase [Streptosporangiaceae bacterium]